MIEQDTIRLLRECDAGIKMGVKSINDVMERVESKELMVSEDKADAGLSALTHGVIR